MEQKTGQTMEIHAMLDESVLRRTLEKIEQLRTSPEAAGLDLHYGAIVSLSIAREQIERGEATLQFCRVQAGGWTSDMVPINEVKGGLQA